MAIDLLYNGPHESIDGMREMLIAVLADVLNDSGNLAPDEDVASYNRTSEEREHIDARSAFQPHQGERSIEVRQALHALGLPATPFNNVTSRLLMNNPPNFVPDFGDGSATV